MVAGEGRERAVGGSAQAAGQGELRLADLLAALSVATDLGMGHEPEKAVRSCLVATELARSSGLPEIQVRDVYYTSLLLHLGCTAPAHELTHLVGDDRRFLARAESIDDATIRGSFELLATVGRGTGIQRPHHVARMLRGGKGTGEAIMRSTCEVGSRTAQRLHLGEGVCAALRDSTEVWDGSSGAFGRAGEDIPVPARFALLSAQAVLFDRLGGPEAAVAMVWDRAGHWFDPEVAATFVRIGPGLLRSLEELDVWDEVLAVEPAPGRCIPPSQVETVARVFADLVDLKMPDTLGHSAGVADVAVAAAGALGFSEERITTLRRAALLHDLGRVAVSGAVWERPRALTRSQWEQVRLHPYHTERILDRSAVLAPVARIAGMHHERRDGTGYHHRVVGAAIPPEARLLAAADAFQAMTQPRPHRSAMQPEQAARTLEADAAAGGPDVECARAVIEAAGQRPARRTSAWPAGLTDREVDVLRHLARGASNRDIATQLVISPRTAEHHVQHIYAKIGGSTRAAAALFAAEHGLVR
jgi:HD-GYP domain-containing protein (c-di-GMP phosphodiesterase class II)